MIERLVAQSSSFAGDIDGLIILVAVLVGFWFLIAEGALLALVFAFRAKPGQKAEYLAGREEHVKRWISFPHALVLICDVFIIVASVQVWYNVKQRLPEADYVIRVIGQQWAWTFQHPGADGVLDTTDDIRTVDDLHVEVDRTYHFQLESRDVVHSFSVPVFRLKQDAVPGRRITGWFRPTRIGRHDVQCAEICGFGHGVMAARVAIEDTSEHAAWIAANTPSQAQ
jgi:cytochrome c oxidase subunit 2